MNHGETYDLQFAVQTEDLLTKWPSTYCTAKQPSFHFCTPGLLHIIAIMELGAECLLWEPSVFLLQPPVQNTKR